MINPYGGTLVNGVIPEDSRERLASPSVTIVVEPNDLIQIINLATGALSPVEGFMDEATYRSVLENNKLPSGLDWPIPILLRTDTRQLSALKQGTIAWLLLPSGSPVGFFEFQDSFEIEKEEFALTVFGTSDPHHAGVALSNQLPKTALSGKVQLLSGVLPTSSFFRDPQIYRDQIKALGWATPVAFSTRNIQHLGHQFQQNRAQSEGDGLGIFAISGAGRSGTFRSEIVLNSYQRLCDQGAFHLRALVSELRLPPLYAGPREAVLQAIMLQNHGFSKFIVGRDHAGVGSFYDQYASQDIFANYSDVGIEILKYEEPFRCTSCGYFSTHSTCPRCGSESLPFNGRDVRKHLLGGEIEQLRNLLSPEVLKDVLSSGSKSAKGIPDFANLFNED